jgi:hypothetical protein
LNLIFGKTDKIEVKPPHVPEGDTICPDGAAYAFFFVFGNGSCAGKITFDEFVDLS